MCIAITLKGAICKLKSRPDSQYCTIHLKKISIKKSKCNAHIKGIQCTNLTENKYCTNHLKSHRLDRPEECVICMDNLRIDDEPLQCGHWFHITCMERWNKGNCPICRIKISYPDHKRIYTKQDKLIIRQYRPALNSLNYGFLYIDIDSENGERDIYRVIRIYNELIAKLGGLNRVKRAIVNLKCKDLYIIDYNNEGEEEIGW